MRKEKMITRTIATTNAEIMAFNLDTNEVITLNFKDNNFPVL